MEGWAWGVAGYYSEGFGLGGVGKWPGPCRVATLGPFPVRRASLNPGTTRATVIILSASSSAAELAPAVRADPEPGTFPQEPPLDPLPGELTTFQGLSGADGSAEGSRDKGFFLDGHGSGQSSPLFWSSGGTWAFWTSPTWHCQARTPIFLLLRPLFDFCSQSPPQC